MGGQASEAESGPGAAPAERPRPGMTRRSLTELILKLMALYMLLSGVVLWAPHCVDFFRQTSWSQLLGASAWMLFFLVLGIGPPLLLVFFADRVAARLSPEDETVGDLQPWTEDAVLRVVVMCLGIFMAVMALPQAAALIASLIQFNEPDEVDGVRVMTEWSSAVRRSWITTGVKVGLKLALGTYMAVSPEMIVKLARLLRRPGSASLEPTEPQDG